ncbi:hypothetical protein PVK06_047760 [Gossypium arboreum]|uniref:Uncharacterized protein n=1 Tax=Gossypium arboreum TaxID=29729 RepID=A0ABR0MEN4_GOSAR|nr:hypothetical protein PVK06_047760 [Gossypium arboreum]
MLYRELFWMTKLDVIDIGGCLVLWAIYRMSFLASVRHQPYVFPLVNRWSFYPGIGMSYIVPIYHLMIEQHAGEGIVEWYNRDRVLRQFGCIMYIPDPPMQVKKIHLINRRGKHGNNWGVVHWKYIAVWDNRMAR